MFNRLKGENLIRIVLKERKSNPLLFDNLADDFFKPSYTNEIQSSSFKVDILTDENAYYLLADLPGYSIGDIQLQSEEQYFTIYAKREPSTLYARTSCLRKERSEGHLFRRFIIEDVNFEKLTYEMTNGLLTIVLPKKNKIG